jgi:hypothetical protein
MSSLRRNKFLMICVINRWFVNMSRSQEICNGINTYWNHLFAFLLQLGKGRVDRGSGGAGWGEGAIKYHELVDTLV